MTSNKFSRLTQTVLFVAMSAPLCRTAFADEAQVHSSETSAAKENARQQRRKDRRKQQQANKITLFARYQWTWGALLQNSTKLIAPSQELSAVDPTGGSSNGLSLGGLYRLKRRFGISGGLNYFRWSGLRHTINDTVEIQVAPVLVLSPKKAPGTALNLATPISVGADFIHGQHVFLAYDASPRIGQTISIGASADFVQHFSSHFGFTLGYLYEARLTHHRWKYVELEEPQKEHFEPVEYWTTRSILRGGLVYSF